MKLFKTIMLSTIIATLLTLAAVSAQAVMAPTVAGGMIDNVPDPVRDDVPDILLAIVSAQNQGDALEFRGIVEFPIDSLTNPVSSLILQVHTMGVNGSNDFLIDLYVGDGVLANDDWDSASLQTFGPTTSTGGVITTHDYSVTATVNQLLGNGDSFLGVRFTDLSVGGSAFSNFGNDGRFNVPLPALIPEPTSLTLLGLGGLLALMRRKRVG